MVKEFFAALFWQAATAMVESDAFKACCIMHWTRCFPSSFANVKRKPRRQSA
jgi:hypothetical protein